MGSVASGLWGIFVRRFLHITVLVARIGGGR